MIKEYVSGLAAQMGMQLLQVTVIEGRRVGCNDVYLINIAAEDKRASTLVYQSEFEELEKGSFYERLEVKIRSALSRLQMMLEP